MNIAEVIQWLLEKGPWLVIVGWLAWRVETKLSQIARRVYQLTVVLSVFLDVAGVDSAKIKERLQATKKE